MGEKFSKAGGTDLLELLDGTRVDTTALVDQVTGGGRLAGIDVADNDDVDVGLVFLTVGGVKSAPIQDEEEHSRSHSSAAEAAAAATTRWKTYPMVTV